MGRGAAILTLVAVTAGCKSVSLGPYVSPRVTGRVVAADSGQPLAGVTIVRGRVPARTPDLPPKGGELLMRRPPITSDRDGRFTLPSERVLTLVRWGGWDSVRLTLERDGYRRFQTNYPASSLTTKLLYDGTPWVDTGEVRLATKLPGNPH